MIKINRREFLKGSAAIGVAGALSGTLLNTLKPATAHASESTATWTPSMCLGCTTWCSVEIKTQTDTGIKRAVDVRGNQNANTHNGYVCPRGRMALQEVYDADRIKTPMKRTNATKGRNDNPNFVPISWDEAMDLIATQMLALRSTNEGHKLVMIRGRYTSVQTALFDSIYAVYGTPNFITHSAICAEAENFSRQNCNGQWGYDDYDIDNAKYLLLWGVDPTSSNRMVAGAIAQLGARMNAGMKVVAIDPRLNTTAAKAHRWLPVKPGTDGAMALAMAHHILVKGLWNKTFVGLDDYVFTAGSNATGTFSEKGTKGLVDWWNTELKNRTPEWAEPITGISASTIKTVAEEFAGAATDDDKAKSISWLGPGVSMAPAAAYSGWAILALNGLVGSFDHTGGSLPNLPSVSAYQSGTPLTSAYTDAVGYTAYKKQRFDLYATSGVQLAMPQIGSGIAVGGTKSTNRIAQNALDAMPYACKMLLTNHGNFAHSCGGATIWEQALSSTNPNGAPYFVFIGTHVGETAMFADIVLPAKHDMLQAKASTAQKARKSMVHGLMNDAVPALWEEKTSETALTWALASKLNDKGYANMYNYLKDKFYVSGFTSIPTNEDEFEANVQKYIATSGSSSNRNTQWSNITSTTYNPTAYGTGKGAGNGIVQVTYGSSDFDSNGRGVMWRYAVGDTTMTKSFGTKSGKIEFYNASSKLATALTAHKTSHSTTYQGIMTAINYTDTAAGIGSGIGDMYALMPHWESPKIASASGYNYTFIDYKSRLNREGRSQNSPWYHEFKSCDPGDEKWKDVVKINPVDAAAIGVKTGDTVQITSPSNTVGITCKVKVWNGVRQGTVAKAYGQGHWATGRYAAKTFGSVPNGGNNNAVIPAEYERLSGATVRNACTKVKIVKV